MSETETRRESWAKRKQQFLKKKVHYPCMMELSLCWETVAFAQHSEPTAENAPPPSHTHHKWWNAVLLTHSWSVSSAPYGPAEAVQGEGPGQDPERQEGHLHSSAQFDISIYSHIHPISTEYLYQWFYHDRWRSKLGNIHFWPCQFVVLKRYENMRVHMCMFVCVCVCECALV